MSDEILNDSLVGGVPHRPYLRNPIDVALQNITVNRKLWSQQVNAYDPHSFTVRLFNYTEAQRDNVYDFYIVHKGGVTSWLWEDYGHSEIARQNIGTGDGAEDEFQIIETKTVGSTSRDINRYNIKDSSYTVWVDSVEQTEGVGDDYTIDTTDSGIITFNAGSIPANTKVVEAAYTYLRRCVFPKEGGYKEQYSEGKLINIVLQFEEILA